jgi:soluble lytic murein transglycosylase-like protein
VHAPLPPPGGIHREPPPVTRRRRLFVWGGLLLALAGSAGILVVLRGRQAAAQRHLIRQVALEEGVDPLLAEAVVEAESGGNPWAVSRARAYGLMQLRLPTAAEVAGRPVTAEELFDPRLNVELGCRYLRRLLDRYRGDERLALMAYNAGMGNLDRWRRKDPSTDRILEGLAFPETRAYVRKVLALRRRGGS